VHKQDHQRQRPDCGGLCHNALHLTVP
jgi:hypothetical protein